MVCVIIERTYVEGMGDMFNNEVLELRQQVIAAAGYVSGETLRDVSDHHHYVVISKWRSLPAWERWFTSSERKEKVASIQALLQEPERITVLEHV